MLRFPIQQLALIEGRLGELASANQRLEKLLPVVQASEAPLAIGAVHRDLARVAVIGRDAASFERHFAAMVSAFRPTKNPSLIQQCRRALAEAERAGVVVAPNWEKHELGAPANTQDMAHETPDVTELMATS